MVRLTVVLVRDATHQGEVRYQADPTLMEHELNDDTVNDDLRDYIGDQVGDEAGKVGQVTLSQRVDPALTDGGYEEAQHTFSALLAALSDSRPSGDRKLAAFSAPYKSCTSTALMLTCADVAKRENLIWRLTTFETASAPAALPIVVSNGLCNAEPHVLRLGGYRGAVEAGLLHCAAIPWNDGRTKCPFMKVFKKMKESTQTRIDEWDEARDESGKKIHHVNYIQFMRLENVKDPWSLKEMIPKSSILVNYAEPKKYMLPPRQGWFDPKKQYKEWNDGVEEHVKEAVWLARQAGCDTVLMVVPGSTLRHMVGVAGGATDAEVTPCCVATLTAVVDASASSAADIQWKWYQLTASTAISTDCIPPFDGPVDEVMHPHEGKDPAQAPENRWAAFPEPEPEVLPRNYPKLPPFSMSLEAPLPPPPKKPKEPKVKQ